MTLLAAGVASAGGWTAGVQAAIVGDPPDAVSQGYYAPGGAVAVPLRHTIRPGADIRVALDLAMAGGHDSVSWRENDVAFESADHWSMVMAGRIFVGPELAFTPGRPMTPYLGAGIGAGVVANFHSFGDDTSLLLDPEQNALDDPMNVDPWTLSFVPAAEVHGGLRFAVSERVAVEVDLGYTASYIPAAPLRKSPPELDARRAAYALDLARVGVGVTVPL